MTGRRTGWTGKPIATLLILVAVAALFLTYRSFVTDSGSYPRVDAQELAAGGSYLEQEEGEPPYYQDALLLYKAAGAAPAESAASIFIPAIGAEASAEAQLVTRRSEESGDDLLHWTNNKGWVEWEFEVGQTGLYTLAIDYEPLPGSFSAIQRGIEIDGRRPFKEAEAFTLDRYWKDGQFPYERNALGNEVRPVQTELVGMRTAVLTDYRTSSQPLLWYLEQGRHTLRMTAGREPVALRELRFAAPRTVPSYEEYRAAHSQQDQGDGAAGQWSRIYEAEQAAAKSKPGIQTVSLREPNITPDPKGRTVYNAIGGERWKGAGEWVEWEIEVPEDGLYELTIQYLQTWRGKVTAFRTISIDGEVPFSECLAYALPSNSRLGPLTVQDENGVPFQFQLTKGRHVLRMTADASPVEPAALALRQALAGMDELDRKLRTLTGNFGFGRDAPNTDSNRTWEIEKYYPAIHEDLRGMIERLEKTAAYMSGLYQAETDTVAAIQVAVETLRSYAGGVEKIPNRLAELTVAQNSLAIWLNQLDGQMVTLDSLEVRTPGKPTLLKESGGLEKLWYSGVDFARTFFMPYSDKSLNKEDAITVWVQRGRDYADALNQMIEQYFTPATGIAVNVNLMPNPNALILSNAAGDQPDVVLGVSAEMPVDYAMRGAVTDLSVFPGFAEAEKRFLSGIMRSYKYDGGTYGLPEIQNFYALYYRTDVFERLGLSPPDTWEEVYRLMPTLQEQGMAFYYPPKDFSVFFLQNEAPFYTPEGNASKLGEKEALASFAEWTDLFDKHLFPLDVPSLIEHFRKGDVPIGIADFSFYIMLNVAAPDIAGKWKMLPIPGVTGDDGETKRWAQQPTAGAMIMKQSDKQEEAWAFLDWWTSADVQRRYGEDMESLYGLEYRWNSANLEAILDMPWPQEELDALREQFRWANNIPIVPGHYFLPRVMDFAWNDRVLRGIPAKEALEDADNSLHREIRRKLEDFGLPPDSDLKVPGDPAPGLKEGGSG